jgi:WXG100 family type VII secretion target
MPDVQMDYDMMEDMAKLFRDGAQRLGDTMQAMQTIAGRLEDGALLGKGGAALAEAILNRLNSRLGRLEDKLQELSGDVYGALVDLRDGDTEAASRFKG